MTFVPAPLAGPHTGTGSVGVTSVIAFIAAVVLAGRRTGIDSVGFGSGAGGAALQG